MPGESEVPGAQRGPDGSQIGRDGVDALHEGTGGKRAELQLAAWFDGECRPQGERPQRGVGGGESVVLDGEAGVVQIMDEPLHFYTDGTRWAGLEADTSKQIIRFRFGELSGQHGRFPNSGAFSVHCPT
ncbi:hypothetical protein GCM10010394_30270 [Streptomyces crystallinus]|uniref:Uncharacterized protein n=1 Tax=Streptomyces crystallinus TaxID=68191 RepID=A0ABN1FVF0_9ACTN